MSPRLLAIVAGASLLLGCPGEIEDPASFRSFEGQSCPADFVVERDLFERTCGSLACHTGGTALAAAGLDLTSPGVADRLLLHTSVDCDARPLINPYDLESSLLIEKLGDAPSCGDRMPSGQAPLNSTERACLDAYLQALVAPILADGGAPADAGAIPVIDAGGPATITIEAEAMTLVGYVEDAASPGIIRLPDGVLDGTASATFSGAPGTYALVVHVRAESDGQPTLRVRVGGIEIASATYGLASTTTGDPATLGPYEVALGSGDPITLLGQANLDAWARIDRVELVP